MPLSMDAIDVLHVDDDPALVDLVGTYLERESDAIETMTATSPEEGFDRLAAAEIDCVVSDYEMPEIDGLEFLERVRADHPDLPFILFTGKGSEEIASEAIAAGVTDYIPKGGTEQYTVLAHRIENAVEQHRAKRRAERTERRLRELAREAEDLLWMYSGDWEELLFINRAYEELFDRPVAELRDHPRSFLEAVHPDDRDRVRAVLDRVANGAAEEVEYRVITDGGDVRWVSVQSNPIRDSDGNVVRIVGYTHDVTERKRRERRYEAILENSYQFTGLLEPDGTIIEANEALRSFADADRETLVGTPIWETSWCRGDEDAARTTKRTVERARTGETVRDELRIRGRDESRDGQRETIVDVSVRPVLDDDGDVESLVLEGRDVTGRKDSKQELRQQQAFIEQAIDTLEDVFYVVGGDGELRRWNDRLETVTGYGTDEIAGMQAVEFFPSDHRDRIAEAIATTFETGEVEVTADFETKGGDRIPYEFTGARLTGPDGDVRGLVGVGRDLSERRRRERELERAERRYRATFEDPNLLVARLEPDGTLREVNETALDYVEADHADLVGTPFPETPWWSHSSELQADARAWIDRAADGEYVEYEREHIRPDGDTSVVNGAFRPVTDDRGVVTSIVVSAQDVTERREHERELERYAALTRQSRDVYTVIDADGTITYQSESIEAVLGYAPAEMVGDPVLEYVHPDDREPVADAIATLPDRDDSAAKRLTFRMRHADGTWRWLESVGSNETGTVLDGYVVTSRDVTERKRRERELERTNDRLEEFVRMVSHDLRNPLNVLSGSLDLAAETGDAEHIETCREAADRMEDLIDDLLTLARKGRSVDDLDRVDLAAVAAECWATVETDDATLAVDVDGAIRADRTRLRQLLENLFRNAVEHGTDDPAASEDLTVTVDDRPNGFVVEDDGTGFDVADPSRLVERGISTAERDGGLGLAIVENVVNAHGWELDLAASESNGARFEVTDVGMAKEDS
ncbi:hybrid sensor histidine kinase/response regulator [Halopenitus persicus]|uniref:histidine kinase n=1 Tax=Halopenitus persicus TaxID=1048396 RepID=A0A1H3FIM1_9EURY|nr:PAS domain S-box protein [Halopenitus persicus]SDX90607.1 PAS domain S-box-containing protein [Halopenitus persicus]